MSFARVGVVVIATLGVVACSHRSATVAATSAPTLAPTPLAFRTPDDTRQVSANAFLQECASEGHSDDDCAAALKDAKQEGLILHETATTEPTGQPAPSYYVLASKQRIFDNVAYCEDAYKAMDDKGAYNRLKDEVGSGAYHDLAAGTKVYVTDPAPGAAWGDKLFVMVKTENGIEGCISSLVLPGYDG